MSTSPLLKPNRLTRALLAAAVSLAFCLAVGASAESFNYVPLQALNITEGVAPWTGGLGTEAEDFTAGARPNWRRLLAISQFMTPYAIGDAGVEAYVFTQGGSFWGNNYNATLQSAFLAVRSLDDKPVTGLLFMPKRDSSGMVRLRFEVGAENANSANPRADFFRAKEAHYRQLAGGNSPGAAWFRHQLQQAQYEAAGKTLETSAPLQGLNAVTRPGRQNDLAAAYNLFSGGRAISENLQLDRVWQLGPVAGEASTPLAGISGITTAEIDWKPLIAGKSPRLDALAAAVPADQHALFFPSFQAMLALMDEAAANGTPVLRLLDPRSEDAGTRGRYEKQLCLRSDELSRLLGPKLIASVAFTGSDPYLRTGSDTAVLFEAPQPVMLAAALAARQAAGRAAQPDAVEVAGEIGGVAYTGVVSPRREVSSYLAVHGSTVIVTNSLAQLKAIAETLKAGHPSLAQADEYVFFRDRYPLGGEETALLVLSDAAIRRWCGPEWRIGAARRTQAAAALAELQARVLPAIAAGSVQPGPIAMEKPLPGFGEISLAPDGTVVSSVYGSNNFLTPIRELGITAATKAEVDAYSNFRNRYQRNWAQFFDPIAVSFAIREGRLAADLTVRPLLLSSDYRQTMELVGTAQLDATAGDPHPGTVVHVVTALDKEAKQFTQAANLGMQMLPGIQANPLSWLGKWFAVYADEDPLWDELKTAMAGAAEAEDSFGQFMEKNVWRLPVALVLDVENAFKLAGFLTAFRAFTEQTAPGMTVGETRQHGEAAFVRVAPSAQAKRMIDRNATAETEMGVYYAISAGSLIISLREDLIKRHLDRQAAAMTATNAATADAPPATPPAPAAPATVAPGASAWLGRSLAARANVAAAQPALEAFMHGDFFSNHLAASWRNLAILNEWARAFRAADPVAFHSRHWGPRLVCPFGGEYKWDEEFQTMYSTATGHPGRQLKPELLLPPALRQLRAVSLGLTFEGDGLRAAAELER